VALCSPQSTPPEYNNQGHELTSGMVALPLHSPGTAALLHSGKGRGILRLVLAAGRGAARSP
jgi:hypothetical protein